MDKIILGALMICGMSAYDLKTFVRKNLSGMCSASAGSIHTALKKLLERGYIGAESSEDDCRDKKMYYITEQGREVFLQWIHTPMSSEKAKNIELAKLFYGGMQEDHEQIAELKAYVMSLQEELQMLLMIREAQGHHDTQVIRGMQQHLLKDSYNNEGIKALSQQELSAELVQRIYRNQMWTLDYGIAATKFQIDWYEQMIADMEDRDE